jgi:hypothetical protein
MAPINPPISNPPISAGSFKWSIPWYFKVNGENSDGKLLKTIDQLFTIDADGALTVSKGEASVTVAFDAEKSNYTQPPQP